MCHTDIPPGQSAPDVDTEEVVVPLAGGEEMPCLLATDKEPGPGILVAPDVHGRSPFYEHLTGLLASHGYTALLADFFFRQGPLSEPGKEAAFARRGQLDETQSVADLDQALDWLKDKSGTDIVGIIGFCMGGTFVLDLASTRKDLAGVAYYGFPVPQAQLKQPPPHPMDLVSDLSGPVLAFWGDQDEVVGMEHAKKYSELAAKADPAFESEIIPGLGHGFLGDADLDDPKDAGGSTWARTLNFFNGNLKTA
jgi:carboxymethylenebutenolidase